MSNQTTIFLPNGFEEKIKHLSSLTENELEVLWNKTGKKTLDHFNLRWYWSALKNWASIDNSHGDRNFQIKLSFNDFQDDKKSSYWERIAVILAHELRI